MCRISTGLKFYFHTPCALQSKASPGLISLLRLPFHWLTALAPALIGSHQNWWKFPKNNHETYLIFFSTQLVAPSISVMTTTILCHLLISIVSYLRWKVGFSWAKKCFFHFFYIVLSGLKSCIVSLS